MYQLFIASSSSAASLRRDLVACMPELSNYPVLRLVSLLLACFACELHNFKPLLDDKQMSQFLKRWPWFEWYSLMEVCGNCCCSKLIRAVLTCPLLHNLMKNFQHLCVISPLLLFCSCALYISLFLSLSLLFSKHAVFQISYKHVASSALFTAIGPLTPVITAIFKRFGIYEAVPLRSIIWGCYW